MILIIVDLISFAFLVPYAENSTDIIYQMLKFPLLMHTKFGQFQTRPAYSNKNHGFNDLDIEQAIQYTNKK